MMNCNSPPTTDISILLADDHGLFRESMDIWLRQDEHIISIGTANSLDGLLQAIKETTGYNLILLDLHMPGMQGAASIRTVCARAADIPVIVVSAEESPVIMRACIDTGASGFVPKSFGGEEMINAIHQVMKGCCYLPLAACNPAKRSQFSPRQMELLSLLAEGYCNKEIAKRMYLSEGTVRQYVSAMLNKLDVDNRTQASIKARSILGIGG